MARRRTKPRRSRRTWKLLARLSKSSKQIPCVAIDFGRCSQGWGRKPPAFGRFTTRGRADFSRLQDKRKKPNTGCGQKARPASAQRGGGQQMQSSWQLEVAREGVLVPAIPATSN